MQPMVNPYLDANCKLDDLTQKVNMICDKMSTLDELSKKIYTFDRTVQNLFKTVEKVSKRVDDVEQGMNFINEKFEDVKRDVSDVKGACAGIREDTDFANDAIFRLQKDLDELEFVRKAAKELRETHFGISEQFPKEVNDKRKELWPHFQETRRQRKKAFFKRDRLFIEGVEYCPSKKDDEKRDDYVPRRQYNQQDNLNISRERNSPDDVVNGFGRKLLEYCKSNKVFILNGRVGQDVNAKPTSRNNSVIDYIICTSHFLQFVSNFEIETNQKQWYDKDCNKAKKELRKSQRLYKHYGSNIFKERLRQSEIYFKKVMDDNIKKLNVDMSDNMNKLKNKNPKEFWKLFNKGRQREKSNISIGTLKPVLAEELEQRISDRIPTKTKQSTSWSMSLWKGWAENRNCNPITGFEEFTCEPVDPETASIKELDFWLSRFIMETRRKDGSPYPPNTLLNISAGIQRHLRENKRSEINLLQKNSVDFPTFQKSLDTRMKEVTSAGLGPFYRRPVVKLGLKTSGKPKFSAQVVGVKKLSTYIKTMFDLAGIDHTDRNISNHSGKVTCVTTLYDKGFDNAAVTSRSGHRSNAVETYKRQSVEMNDRISKYLQPPLPRSEVKVEENKENEQSVLIRM
ncbi:unnamed protein product [Mytilus coruscus]|uniref:QRICH1-like domain-containing protein n=1 Tax=Mytilus coruscus TaxID=42192 RepID=A0A6J8CBM3_MYTCO|nr:unnamed protein product [Mytilus coruscus]